MGDWIDVQTLDGQPYIIIPETSGAVKLKVKAASDATIALSNGPCQSNPITEIRIGGLSNTKSIIKRDRQRPDKAEASTPGILNATEYVDLWIRWHNNEVSAGVRGQPAFIKYLDPDPHPINYIGVGSQSGFGTIGHWKIEVSPLISRTLSIKPIEGGQLRWVRKTQKGIMPKDALIGGYENGEALYIIRSMHGESLIPGKYVPSEECAYICFGPEIFTKNTYEVLCGYNSSWVKTRGNLIPPHAFAAGYCGVEPDQKPLYIGRARVGDNLIPGQMRIYICYIPYKNEVLEMGVYEILVQPDQLPDAVLWRGIKGANANVIMNN